MDLEHHRAGSSLGSVYGISTSVVAIGGTPSWSAWPMYYADPFSMPIVDGEVLHLPRS
jgi:hypothetical protein